MSTDGQDARLDAAPRHTDCGRFDSRLIAHGIDAYVPTADEADVIAKARFEKSTREVLAERASPQLPTA